MVFATTVVAASALNLVALGRFRITETPYLLQGPAQREGRQQKYYNNYNRTVYEYGRPSGGNLNPGYHMGQMIPSNHYGYGSPYYNASPYNNGSVIGGGYATGYGG